MPRFKRDFHSLKKKLLERGELYVDPDFPADNKSLTYSGYLPAGLPVTKVEWMRPKDILRVIRPRGSPKFVAGTLTRSDLDQGMLGDCWFVAAASVLATGPRNLFERVVPLDQSFDKNEYAGIFHFKFWWYGEWKEVIIDDFLPTDGRQLIYCSNWEEPEEFWGALLEKAYAKLRGNYEALGGGKMMYALVDMTGGLGEQIRISNKADVPENLYEFLRRSFQMNSLLGASIHNPEGVIRPEEGRRRNGLYTGHAYAITRVNLIPFKGKDVQLLRMRNPHGRKEWLGPWSDNSPEMKELPQEIKDRYKMESKDEGEFWISFDDFLYNFDEVQLSHLQPDVIGHDLSKTLEKQEWSVTEYHDEWIRGISAGGCGNPPHRDLFWKNPQFQLHLKDSDVTDEDKCTVIISLTEKEKEDVNELSIGFAIYQFRKPLRRPIDENEKFTWRELIRRDQSGTYMSLREVVKRFVLAPGHYVIIPSTFYPHKEGKFLLRIYTAKEAESEVLDDEDPPEIPTIEPKDPETELLRKHAGEDGMLDFKELGKFLQEATKQDIEDPVIFNDECCRSLHTAVDSDHSGYIEFDEAKNALHRVKSIMAIFKAFDKDKSGSCDTIELGAMFKQLGFPVSRVVLTSIVRRYGGRKRKINPVDFITVMSKLLFMDGIFQAQAEKTDGPKDTAQFTRKEFFTYTMLL